MSKQIIKTVPRFQPMVSRLYG